MSFKDAVIAQTTETTNGMSAFVSSQNANADFFFKAGAMREQNPIPAFTAAFQENSDLAIRTLLWLRDIRGGAGERKTFYTLLNDLVTVNFDLATRVVKKIPELGYWGDIWLIKNTQLRNEAYKLLKAALEQGNGLAAKWTPRQDSKGASEFRNFLGMSPKKYRKYLVQLSNTVEQKLCAQDYDNINFNHVPSRASHIYSRAFKKHCKERYNQWLEDLHKPNSKAKVNAAAIFPHDIVYNVLMGNEQVPELVQAQWDALPNYASKFSAIPLADVSGSMDTPVAGNVRALDISISLGLYISDKMQGPFKDLVLTFSTEPEALYLKGNIIAKIKQLAESKWGQSTSIENAFKLILKIAKKAKVPQAEMPQYLIILSDMQFDIASENADDTAFELVNKLYKKVGYTVPRIIFWNLNAYGNVPASYNEQGAALISGFSPSILKSFLDDFTEFTPENIMLKTLMDDRYNY